MALNSEPEGTRYCVACGQPLAADAGSCAACGATAAHGCPVCGQLNPGEARFCCACGGALAVAAPAQRGPAEAAEGVARRAGSGRSRLAERKLVTIMFADMIDSLAAIRDADPEEAHELFSVAVDEMTAAIHDYGGSVIGTTGDGVLAVFGAPAALEDHAERACHAALGVIERLSEARRHRPLLDVRIGLHSGEVAVGTSANDFSIDYGATGAPVHIASRLQSAAPPGCAVVSAATRGLLRGAFAWESLGPVRVKGLDAPMELFVLKGPAGAGPGEEAARREPFVGRAAELGLLRASLETAQSGSGRVVLVSGEAGIGKTALIRRFLARDAESFRVVRGVVERYRGAAPFAPFRGLLLELFGLTRADAEARAAAVGAWAARAGDDADYMAWALLDLFETGRAAPAWHALDPGARNRMMTRAILRALAGESRRRPLVLVIEDLQRADSCSVEVLGRLIEEASAQPLLALLTARPDFQPGWQESLSFWQLRLERLSRPETEDLTRRLLGASAVPALADSLIDWSQGNPLYLRETVRMLAESEAAGAEPARRLPGAGAGRGAIAAPASVRAIIAERIDRLPSRAKEVLLAASVLGEAFDHDVLAEVAGGPEGGLDERLNALERAAFIAPAGDGAAAGHHFCHPLFQEVCYGTLLRQRRVRLHAAAFAAIAARSGADPAASVENLADHAYNGQLWREAVVYCRAAGQRAASRSAPREAAGHLRRALSALDHLAQLEPGAVAPADAIDIRLELRTALVQLLELSAAQSLVREAHALARELGDRKRLARVVALLAVHDYLQRTPASAAALARESIAIAEPLDDASLLVAPNICLAQACYGLGRYRETVAILERLLPLIPDTAVAAPSGLPGTPLLICWYWIAISKAELGLFDEAETLARRMAERASALQVFDSVYAGTALGFIQMTRGEYRAALRASAQAHEIAERNDFPYLTPVLASQYGLLLAREGEAAEALRLGRHAVDTAARIGVYAGRSRWCARLAEICMLAGELDEARAHLETAFDVAESAGEQGYLCSALALRARYALQVGADPEDARPDLARALPIARRLGIRPTFAKCLLQLAALERAAGREASARRKCAAALRRFRACAMPAWQQRAREELARSETGRELRSV